MDKKAHKERVQERRDRKDQERRQEEKKLEQTKWWHTSIEQYDRVWYQVGPDEYKRGTVESITRTQDDRRKYRILPIDAMPEEQHRCVFMVEGNAEEGTTTTYSTGHVIKDVLEWSTRFRTGDHVKILWGDEDGYSYWLPALVAEVWYFDTSVTDTLLPYRCRVTDEAAHIHDALDVSVPKDSDDVIQSIPTTFRFSEGDEVIFNSEHMMCATARRKPKENWVKGIIKEVAVLDANKDYAVYTCSYWDSRRETCSIVRDDDEHIAAVNATPRERLFNAIEYDCSYDHLDYLIRNFELDVTSFQDLAISKAIEFGSYEALLWLQENNGVILSTIRDAEGNTYLYQMLQGRMGFIYQEGTCDCHL